MCRMSIYTIPASFPFDRFHNFKAIKAIARVLHSRGYPFTTYHQYQRVVRYHSHYHQQEQPETESGPVQSVRNSYHSAADDRVDVVEGRLWK